MRKASDFGFFLIRTSTFPIEDFIKLNEVLESCEDESVNSRSKELFKNELFLEAIYLASKGLYQTLLTSLEHWDINNDKLHDLIRTLYKYYSRMCSRPTPYGLFAACAYGTISDQKSELYFDNSRLKRKFRLDMGLMAEVVRYIEQVEDVASSVRYSPNTSIYTIDNSYRFVEHELSKTKRVYRLSSLAVSPSLQKVLECCESGLTKQEIECQLAEQLPGVSGHDIGQYVNTLIAYKFLTSDVDLCAIGNDHLSHITQKMARMAGKGENLHSRLSRIGEILGSDQNILDLEDQLRSELAYFECGEHDTLVQCDLFSGNEFKLSQNVLDEIVATASELMHVSGAYENQNLSRFKTEFYSRYEGREVPLAEVLDPEIGIGYGLTISGNIEQMPLIEKVSISVDVDTEKVAVDSYLRLVVDKYSEFLQTGADQITIEPADLRKISFQVGNARYAETSIVMGNILSSSAKDLDGGDYLFHAIRVGNPYAGKMLGRFAASHQRLSEGLKEIIQYEQMRAPDFLLAEIAHLPDDRLANIIVRPQVTEYEIPYLSNSTADQDKKILVSDLMVSVFDGKVLLRSKTLNKYILPKLTNAHNTFLGVNIYKFLSDLQYDNLRSEFGWNWSIFEGREYLPRVVYKKFILSRARWFFRKDQFAKCKNLTELYTQLPDSLRCARYVVIIESDNELLIDLQSRMGMAVLDKRSKKNDVVLHEYLGLSHRNPVVNNGATFFNEIILPIRNTFNDEFRAIIPPKRADAEPQVKRTFILGSEWLYFKMYCANKWQEKILSEVLLPFATQLLEAETIQKWFFIKYNDPKPHLRFRMLVGHGQFPVPELLDKIKASLAPFIDASIVANVVYDTYHREIERYGIGNMENSETLFCLDSIAVGKSIDWMLRVRQDLRLLCGLRSVDALFDDFQYTLADRLRVARELNEAFIMEFNGSAQSDVKLRKSLNDKYRTDRANVSNMLADIDHLARPERVAAGYFQQRSEGIRKIASQIAVSVPDLDDVLKSYIHMSLNRLFPAKQRQHELVVYHYLTKHYLSLNARKAGPIYSV